MLALIVLSGALERFQRGRVRVSEDARPGTYT